MSKMIGFALLLLEVFVSYGFFVLSGKSSGKTSGERAENKIEKNTGDSSGAVMDAENKSSTGHRKIDRFLLLNAVICNLLLIAMAVIGFVSLDSVANADVITLIAIFGVVNLLFIQTAYVKEGQKTIAGRKSKKGAVLAVYGAIGNVGILLPYVISFCTTNRVTAYEMFVGAAVAVILNSCLSIVRMTWRTAHGKMEMPDDGDTDGDITIGVSEESVEVAGHVGKED